MTLRYFIENVTLPVADHTGIILHIIVCTIFPFISCVINLPSVSLSNEQFYFHQITEMIKPLMRGECSFIVESCCFR